MKQSLRKKLKLNLEKHLIVGTFNPSILIS